MPPSPERVHLSRLFDGSKTLLFPSINMTLRRRLLFLIVHASFTLEDRGEREREREREREEGGEKAREPPEPNYNTAKITPGDDDDEAGIGCCWRTKLKEMEMVLVPPPLSVYNRIQKSQGKRRGMKYD